MSLAEKYCLTFAFILFMIGLFTGIWRYWLMVKSEESKSRYYVDTAHRTSFLYAFSALLLGIFARYSVFPAWLNERSALSALLFFFIANAMNLISGFKSDTNNQIKDSKNGVPGFSPMWLVHSYMVLLIIAEVGGSTILGVGALLSIWS